MHGWNPIDGAGPDTLGERVGSRLVPAELFVPLQLKHPVVFGLRLTRQSRRSDLNKPGAGLDLGQTNQMAHLWKSKIRAILDIAH